jgi:hypothetical protein
MKTTKPKLLNLIITASVTINLVLLGGVGCIASIDHQVTNIYSTLNSPVMVYIPKTMESSEVNIAAQSPAAQ